MHGHGSPLSQIEMCFDDDFLQLFNFSLMLMLFGLRRQQLGIVVSENQLHSILLTLKSSTPCIKCLAVRCTTPSSGKRVYCILQHARKARVKIRKP